ncbi:MAG: zinc-binding dehydrogenase [Actinomycetota bacterium]|nr:zinc-binding dehydrogenase [Actinomycetota bacterium]
MGVDIVDKRVEMALKFGADVAVNSSKVNAAKESTNDNLGKGADMAIECSGKS